MRLAAGLALAAVLAGCGDDGAGGDAAASGDAMTAAPPELPTDVTEVLRMRCQPCHSDPVMRYAPMPIVTWEDTRRMGPYTPDEPVYALIGARVQSDAYPMPPKESPELAAFTDEERAILVQWSDDGGPAE